MICPTCSGNGTLPILDEEGRRIGVRYCPLCNGRGEVEKPYTKEEPWKL